MITFKLAVQLICAAGLITACGCAVAAMKQKSSEQQKYISGMTVFIAILWLGSVIMTNASDPGEMFAGARVAFTGSCHIYLFQLMLMIAFCRIKPPRMLYPLLCAVNIVINAAALTIGRSELFFRDAALSEYNGISILTSEPGPFYKAYLAMEAMYSIIIAGSAIIGVVRDKERFTAVGVFVIASLIPTAASALSFAGFTFGIDLTPAGYLISEIMIFVLIYSSKIYDVQDTARQYVFDTLEDGIIVLDRHQRLKGYNEVAKQIFPELKYAKPDMRIDAASPDINKIMYEKATEKISVGSRVYNPSIRKITDGKREKRLNGYVIWVTDITEQERNAELSANFQRELERDVSEKTARIVRMQEQMIYSFATLVESRDSITGEHVRRTSEYVAVLAAEMRNRGLYPRTITTTYLEYLRLAAPLHDIGKITVPDSILKKPGKLSPEEFEIMKNHTVEGGRILEDTLKNIEGESFYDVAKDVALYHHEKWNGTGYPYGTAGENIPLSARIMAVADFFDALTSSRPYKKAYSAEKAYSILVEESGKSFDPNVVDCFMRSRSRIEEILMKYGGSLSTQTDVLSERDRG